MSASLIGRLGSSTFRLSSTPVSMSLTGSRFSTDSAPGPFHHGIRRRGGTIFGATFKRVLAVALEMTRVSLGLTDDLADGIIAKQIVELAKTGERNPDLLCEAALKKLHGICIATSTLRAKRRASPLGLASLLLSLAVCRSRMNCGTHLKGSHSLSLLFRL